MTELSKPEVLRNRSKAFAIRVIHMCRTFPRTLDTQIIVKQALRSATSVAANYRAVCRARSKAEFVAKIGIAVEEADETVFWLEMLADSGIVKSDRLAGLIAEANELLAILAASQRTSRSSQNRSDNGQMAR